MKHLNEGQIRAFQDGELEQAALQHTADHLATCRRCREKAAIIQSRAGTVSQRLSGLTPEGDYRSLQEPNYMTSGQARARFTAHLAERETKEKVFMWNKFKTRIPRSAWVTLAVVVILATALAFPPVRAIANSFLGLFRVEQVRVVPINPAEVADQLGSSSQLEQMLTQNIEVETTGEARQMVNKNEAGNLAGMKVKLPSALDGQPVFYVQPGGKASFTVDLALVQSVLGDIGRADIELPKTLDGAMVDLVIPSAVMAGYGDCDFDPDGVVRDYDPDSRLDSQVPSGDVAPIESNCITLLQVPSPTISAPPGLDIARIGEAYLQLLGMDAAEATSFARNVDWTTTMVVPIPRYGVEYEDVQVNGVTGTLMVHQRLEMYVLMWVKDGIVYALTGPGNGAQAVKIANSLQ
jgi:hypothetical protein